MVTYCLDGNLLFATPTGHLYSEQLKKCQRHVLFYYEDANGKKNFGITTSFFASSSIPFGLSPKILGTYI